MSRTYAYADSDADIRVALEKVTDTIMSDTLVLYWIDNACDWIDSRLANKFTVPFTTTPPIIKKAATCLASYSVLRVKFIKSEPEGNAWIASFKNEGEKIIKDLLGGDLVLIDSSGSEISPITNYGIQSSTEAYSPVFNQGEDSSWAIDSDRTSDEA